MPEYHVGKPIKFNLAVYREVVLTAALINLALSSESSESTYLGSPTVLPSNQLTVTLPADLVLDLYCLFIWEASTASWKKLRKFERLNDRVKLDEYYKGLILAFPAAAFEDTLYANGTYTYEMYLTRTDSRVYRNLRLSSAAFKPNKFVSIHFSFSELGPWTSELFSLHLFDTFYIQIVITGMQELNATILIPSEVISLTCVTCE